MKSRIFYFLATVLQVIFLIAAYVIQYFSMDRMGMMRYVVYISHEWEAQYPIIALKYGAIVFLVILPILIVLYFNRKSDSNIIYRNALPMLILGFIITFAFVIFTLVYSTESYRSYYFTCLILAIIALIQNIKIVVCFKKRDYRRGLIL